MKRRFTFYIFFFLLGSIGFGQDGKELHMNLTELIANPEKFSGKMIAICGFLLIQHAPHELTTSILYLNEEDQKQSLMKGILVIPSKQMIKEKEKLNRRYVSLTGEVNVTPAASGGQIVTISKIQSCVPMPNVDNSLGLIRRETEQ